MNINETITPCIDPDIHECWKCGSTDLAGQVNDHFGFCIADKQAVIDGFAELASYGGTPAHDITIDVKVLPSDQATFDTQYAELSKRGEDLARRIKAATTELERIKAQLRELGPGSYLHEGRTIATVGTNPLKFDESLAQSVLTLEQQAQVTKTVIDAAAVKALFGDDVYDSCRKDQGGKPAVNFPGAK